MGALVTYGIYEVVQAIKEQQYSLLLPQHTYHYFPYLPFETPPHSDALDSSYRELSREKQWSRVYLLPLLQAEQDRDSVRRALAAEDREKFLMKDVKGWEYGNIYNNDK